jgi:uncharacterized protein (DUF1501 family)
MSESNPTPGPWSAFVVEETMTVAVDIGPHPSGKRPNVVDWGGFDTCGLPLDQQVANARLIAAAPDLLAALKLAVEQLEAHGFDGLASGASAAIAKASGDVL